MKNILDAVRWTQKNKSELKKKKIWKFRFAIPQNYNSRHVQTMFSNKKIIIINN